MIQVYVLAIKEKTWKKRGGHVRQRNGKKYQMWREMKTEEEEKNGAYTRGKGRHNLSILSGATSLTPVSLSRVCSRIYF